MLSRIGAVVVAVALAALSGETVTGQVPPGGQRPLPDVDVRADRPAAPSTLPAPPQGARERADQRRSQRTHPHTGAARVLDAPGLSTARSSSGAAIRALVAGSAERLGLERGDLESLDVIRDYVSASNGLRHVSFSQSFDGIPVFEGIVTVHIDTAGTIVRVASGAARGRGRIAGASVPASQAAATGAANAAPGWPFAPVPLEGPAGPRERARFARGPLLQDVTAALTWFPMDGGLRLAWHVEIEPPGEPQLYDVLVDARSGEILLRRNRVRSIEDQGRVIQSGATHASEARRPDAMPLGSAGCPPAINHELRDLRAPFRDPATVLFTTGRLEGNNTQVLRGDTATPSAPGTFNGSGWTFDFPFSSAGSAESALFFALNYAHDFFYDLGFDEAAGNFQADNFGRGGLGGDPVKGVARAAGRNNATFRPEPEGTSPVISMFLWDGWGCWAEDVDGDGTLDIDGDFDLDIVLHEFHHGVSHRLNTAFTGPEADAIGEGASDFFAYSVNNDTTLAEYSYAGGIRRINGKTYADWFCLLGLFCQPHANGEIFANALWDVRERFRSDRVRGSEEAGIRETHQLYVDALKLSPPMPTMLDIRDAMLQADTLRNPADPTSANYCRIWESFAWRGMGLNATDTADNGSSQVGPDFNVPAGCEPPPAPPVVTVQATVATAYEAGTVNGLFTLFRSTASAQPLTVTVSFGGTASKGSDYVTPPTALTIPAGAASLEVPIAPVDDLLVENNETVVLTVVNASSYTRGTPSAATVTIVSDDTAPDLTVSALEGPDVARAGGTIQVTDTVRNQGAGNSPLSKTSLYLSANTVLDASDPLLGARDVPALASGSSSSGTTTLELPGGTAAGTYYLIAVADGPEEVYETSEYNNRRYASVRVGPDLVVTALSAPTTAGAGMSITVSDTTSNQGGEASGASATRFYLSSNFSWDETDIPLQARTVPTLAPGGSSSGTTSVTIPQGTPTGTRYLIARADSGDAVGESLESNNTKWTSLRIGPDLQVSPVSAPTRVAASATIAVSDTTKNAGAGAAGPSAVAFYVSSNSTLDAGDVRLAATRPVPGLAPGASSSGSSNVVMPDVPPGVWYLIARADDLDVVEETYETNNTRGVLVHVGPDLDVTTMSAPSTAVAGATISVGDTVKNLGAATAPASVTTFYLSSNTVLDESDQLLHAQRQVPSLVMNATSAGSTAVTLPAGVSGVYYIIAVADGPGGIAESSEANNTSYRKITINP